MIENFALFVCISKRYITAQPNDQSRANLSFASSSESSSICFVKAIEMKEHNESYIIGSP